MKAVIDGTTYDMAVLASPKLNDLYYLKVETGMSLTGMQKAMQRFDSQFGGLSEESLVEAMDDTEFMQMLRALFWLIRRAAGERMTVDEANDFGLDTLKFIPDDPDPEESADPPTPVTGSAPGSGVAPAKSSSGSRRRSGTTSGKRS